jgi:FtsH-binding integral membrane protein
VTVVTFALALTALPDSVPYPFTDPSIAAQWPGDYLWMYPAMVLMLLFVGLFAAVHQYASAARRLYSLLGLSIAVIAAAVLIIDYYIQVTVMQPSLEKGQLEGWAIFTQYNPNGIFLALEEIGYLLMSLALFCLVPVFAGRSKLERSLRWLLAMSFVAVVVALAVVSALLGIDRGDDFEIIVISLVWLTLIATGPMTAAIFRRALSPQRP